MISFLFSENQPTPPAVDCIRGNCVKSQQAQKLRLLSLNFEEFSGNIADLERVQIDPDQLAADLERLANLRNHGGGVQQRLSREKKSLCACARKKIPFSSTSAITYTTPFF